MFEKRKDRKQHEAEIARHAELQDLLARRQRAVEWAKLDRWETQVPGVVLKKGEIAYLVIQRAGFVEPKRLPGHWAGGSHGVSFRIAKGMRYHVGQSRGTYVQGEEVLQPTDRGVFVVTNQRCLFVGAKRSTEWAYTKLMGFSLEGSAQAIFNVSNRQKATGVQYKNGDEAVIDAVIAAAIARFQGDQPFHALLAEMHDDVNELQAAIAQTEPAGVPSGELHEPVSIQAAQPTSPQPTSVDPTPAGWYPDPTRRFDARWFDGNHWTEHVGRIGADGQRSTHTDPLNS